MLRKFNMAVASQYRYKTDYSRSWEESDELLLSVLTILVFFTPSYLSPRKVT